MLSYHEDPPVNYNQEEENLHQDYSSLDTKNKSQYYVYEEDDDRGQGVASVGRYNEKKNKFQSVIKLADVNLQDELSRDKVSIDHIGSATS